MSKKSTYIESIRHLSMSFLQLVEGDIAHVELVLNVVVIVFLGQVLWRLTNVLCLGNSILHSLIESLKSVVFDDRLGFLGVDEQFVSIRLAC